MYKEHQKLSDKLYMYSMESQQQKILVVCSFHDKQMRFQAPKDFDIGSAKLILCNYENPELNTLKPFEARVYLWK